MSYSCTLTVPSGLGLLCTTRPIIRKKANVERREILRKIAQQQPAPAPTTTPTPTPTVNAASPDIFDRFRDIWNFIKHGLTLLWYKGRARTGNLNNEQWNRFQEAAQGLANNRTFKDVHGWWYGKDADEKWKKWGYLGTAARDLKHLHRLRAIAEKTSNDPNALQGYYKRKKVSSESLKNTIDYFKKYHGATDDDFKGVTDLKLDAVNPNATAGWFARGWNGIKKVWNNPLAYLGKF